MVELFSDTWFLAICSSDCRDNVHLEGEGTGEDSAEEGGVLAEEHARGRLANQCSSRIWAGRWGRCRCRADGGRET